MRNRGLRLLLVSLTVALPRVGIVRLRSAAPDVALEALLALAQTEVQLMFNAA